MPVLVLASAFHSLGSVPSLSWLVAPTTIQSASDKFERYFSRKGWFGFGSDTEPVTQSDTADAGADAGVTTGRSVAGNTRILVE